MSQQYLQIPVHPKPFVKWAGGKRQLIPQIEKYIPKKYSSYFEPFLGGGALLFHLLSKNKNLKGYVSDLNSDLVLSYVTIRDNLDSLLKSLQKHSDNYFSDSNSYYYSVRESNPKSQIEKVSRLLFLNRTCFNGLYRVNSKGKFNVPLGRYSNPNIVQEENLRSVNQFLNNNKISIKCQDFSSTVEKAKKGDFVYFDPPYQPVSKTANFTSYTNGNFGINDLKRLAKVSNELAKKGVNVLLSNSSSKQVRDLFLPKYWKIIKIEANRAINSDSNKRTGHSELLIKNY
ncbi:MAG TPA: DNA adenine methylase [Nitrosopumilaceae archaeon]|nr:DNA adenine methylase [Nitrosopumilaceae archaeon]